jgi:glycerol kinase
MDMRVMVHPTGTPQDTGSDALILAIDQGTTNAKALIVDAERKVVASASTPVSVSYPVAGWVEQDAGQIWAATLAAARSCLAHVGEPTISGIAISTQRESAVAWSAKTGIPLGPVLGWQDARTASWCHDLATVHGDTVSRRTGLPIDPMYSAPKMRWLFDAAIRGGADPSDVRLGTIDSWLCWNLSGRFLAEAGNASRTLLLDLETLDWNPDLLEVFGVPAASLAPVVASNGAFGATTPGCGLPSGVPIVAVLADSHAAMYAQGCTKPGQAKATYGTGSSIMTPAVGLAEQRPAGLTTTLAWLTDRPVYAYEGNIVASGAALDWMCRTLGIQSGAELSELASTVASVGGVSFVPAFTGLGAPHWDREAVGILAGLSAGTTRAHLARAAIEAVAHQVADVVEAVEVGSGVPIELLSADGGATASAVLMQTQADLLGRPVRVSGIAEASAIGAAMLALTSLGAVDARAGIRASATYDPHLPAAERESRRRDWETAISRARLRARPRAPLAHENGSSS